MADRSRRPEMPSDTHGDPGLFDRFATIVSDLLGRASFFAFCVILVAVWLPSYWIVGNLDTWQLIINTITTIITFLMVALLQNSQHRSDEALQQKLNALATGLADIMRYELKEHDEAALRRDLEELADAVGLEDRETSS